MRQIFISVVGIIVLMAGVDRVCLGQSATKNSQKLTVAMTEIKGQRFEAASLGQLLAKVSLEYSVPIGFEASGAGDRNAVSMDFKGGVLSDLLDELARTNALYGWQEKNGVINVLPKDGQSEPAIEELLMRTIKWLVIKKGMSCGDLSQAIMTSSEVKPILMSRGIEYQRNPESGFFIKNLGPTFSMGFKYMSIRSILNTVIKESPTAKYWSMGTTDRDPKAVQVEFAAKFD